MSKMGEMEEGVEIQEWEREERVQKKKGACNRISKD